MEQHDCPSCEAMRLAIVGYKAKTINELRRILRLRHVPEQGGFPIGSMTKVHLIESLVGQDFPNDDVNDAMIDFMADGKICECYLECGADSHSGRWHTHEGEPCLVHPEATMVG